MTAKEYKEKLQNIQSNLYRLEEEECDIRELKKQLEEDYEDKIWNINNSISLQRDIEEDWYNRNMLFGSINHSDEKMDILKQLLIQNEEFYSNSLNNINCRIRENMKQRDIFYEQMNDLSFEVLKEDEDGENY